MKKVCSWRKGSTSLLCLFLSISSLSANMQKNLESAFTALGMANNVTAGGGYQDQTGGFYTGGSVFARSKVNNADLLSIQMPDYRAGCGGIDLYTGGLSFISMDEFTQLLRSIGSNASGYAFNLALATVTPQIKSVLDDLSNAVREITSQSINSCEAAATLMGGVWPQSDKSSAILCNAMGTSLGKAKDWAQSRQKCGVKGERESINDLKETQEGKEFKDILGDEFNIAWKALQKNGFLSKDPELAEFFMTISGTIISRRIQKRTEVIVLPSKSDDPDLINGLVMGKTKVKVYQCDQRGESQCLKPVLKDIVLDGEKALFGKVSAFLLLLSTSIREGTSLKKQDIEKHKAFVNSTKIPILKILAIEAAFKEGGSPISSNELSETIAYDILLHYLEEVMSLVLESITQLQKTQIDGQVIEKFREGVLNSQKLLIAKRTALFEQMAITLDFIERTQQIESKLQNMFISSQQGTESGGK
ncbi:MAG: conjugal transfer protein TraH [Alphaproteobacteria bacterium]|nr:conjugal transfer protein TraH [Alphaproteobacteria bacterium]